MTRNNIKKGSQIFRVVCTILVYHLLFTFSVKCQDSVPLDLSEIGLEFPSTPEPEQPVNLPVSALDTPPSQMVPEEFPTRSPLDVAIESLTGDADSSRWRPLSFRSFLTEGWNEPFVFTPRSTSGAPRQGWINSFDGVMYRLWFNAFGYKQNVGGNGNSFYSDWTVFLPLNRRLDIRLDVPYIQSNKGGESNKYLTQFGDLTATARFLLSETQDTSVIAVAATTMPTGRAETGGGTTQLAFGSQFWHSMPDRWIIRGGINFIVPVNNYPDGIRTNGNVNLAVGKYVTDPGKPIFGDLVLYTAANFVTSMDNRGPNNTFFSLTPGYRAEISDNWYHLAGIEVPMVGGPSRFTYGFQFWILKVF